MIWQVRSKLPSVVKDLLKDEEYNTWANFTKAVTELKGSRLAEKQEQHISQTQELKALRADLARVQLQAPQQNPITALQSQLNKLSLSPTAPSNNNSYSRVPATPSSHVSATICRHGRCENNRLTARQRHTPTARQPERQSSIHEPNSTVEHKMGREHPPYA
jgi:hypothetical protein